jgi:hypothetical protein
MLLLSTLYIMVVIPIMTINGAESGWKEIVVLLNFQKFELDGSIGTSTSYACSCCPTRGTVRAQTENS